MYVSPHHDPPTVHGSPLPKENVPPSIRSIAGIFKLLRNLLPNDRSSSSIGDCRLIQSIYFPPHHQDLPSAQPKCKGFALLTLSEPSAASHLLASFPYHRTRANSASVPANHNDHDDEAPPEELEARKAGFRTLSKERWEALQSEYVEYREALLQRIATSSSSTAPPPAPGTVPNPPSPSPDNNSNNNNKNDNDLPQSVVAPSRDHQAPSTTSRPTPSRYPPGCVIFVRHVPTDTNKTALRARFSALLAEDGNDDHNMAPAAAALDYVDYTKGLDSVRLSPLLPRISDYRDKK